MNVPIIVAFAFLKLFLTLSSAVSYFSLFIFDIWCRFLIVDKRFRLIFISLAKLLFDTEINQKNFNLIKKRIELIIRKYKKIQ